MTHTDMDAPPAPLERGEKANARREKVVQAARVLFAEQGFHATGMAAISQASGVLVGQIYRDFANKEAIVAAIVERDLDEYLREGELHETCACDDPAALRAWVASHGGPAGAASGGATSVPRPTCASMSASARSS